MANIKTIALSGAEIRVEISGQNCAIRNDGTDAVYASRTAGITAGADGVLAVPAGQSAVLRDTCGALYLLGTGSVQLVGADYDAVPFKTVSASGGSGADEVARAAISAHTGNAEIHVTADEKSAWNAKAELTDIPTTLPANGGNADTLGGIPASELERVRAAVASGELENGTAFAALDASVGDTHIRAQINSDSNRLTLYRTTDNWKTQTTLPLPSDHQVEHILPDGTDVLAYITSEFCPSGVNTIVRILNSPTCPTNYEYSASDNDFFYDIFKLDNYWARVKAYDVRNNYEFVNGCAAGVWSGWLRSADGGNADTINVGEKSAGTEVASVGYPTFANNNNTNAAAESMYTNNAFRIQLRGGVADDTSSGYAQLKLGNILSNSVDGHMRGQVVFYCGHHNYHTILEQSSNQTENQINRLPAKAGTLALESDLAALQSEYDALAARVAALEGGT